MKRERQRHRGEWVIFRIFSPAVVFCFRMPRWTLLRRVPWITTCPVVVWAAGRWSSLLPRSPTTRPRCRIPCPRPPTFWWFIFVLMIFVFLFFVFVKRHYWIFKKILNFAYIWQFLYSKSFVIPLCSLHFKKVVNPIGQFLLISFWLIIHHVLLFELNYFRFHSLWKFCVFFKVFISSF